MFIAMNHVINRIITMPLKVNPYCSAALLKTTYATCS